jgi:peptide/nickel transport system permease protein
MRISGKNSLPTTAWTGHFPSSTWPTSGTWRAASWGAPIAFGVPVAELLVSYLPWTLLLMSTAILLANVISLLLGTHSAWVRNSVADRSLLGIFLFLNTLPVFLFGALLLMVFAVRLDWLPMAGGRTPFATFDSRWQELGDRLRHLALPLATLTMGMAGRNFLIARNSTIGVLGQDFMLVVRGKGLPPRIQKYRHAMRNAMMPWLPASRCRWVRPSPALCLSKPSLPTLAWAG